MPKLIPTLINPVDRRKDIREKVKESFTDIFPTTIRNKTINLSDLNIEEKEFNSSDQKDALLGGKSLTENVRGNLQILDKNNKVLGELKNHTLLKLPWFTPRHTFILGGSEYSIANMLRMKPGIYTRRKANNVVEAIFNPAKLGRGTNFRLSMAPEKGLFYVEYGGSKIPLYPVLRAMGIPHSAISEKLGTRLSILNKEKLEGKRTPAINRLYEKVLPRRLQQKEAPEDTKLSGILEVFDKTEFDPEVNRITLGKGYKKVTPQSLLDAAGKLTKIYKEEGKVDDRDSLVFKRLLSVDDFFKEQLKQYAPEVLTKAMIKMERPNPIAKKALPTGAFTKKLHDFINTSTLSSIPTQVNPIELVDNAIRVTSLGEGGITTERAVPEEARAVHVTHTGVLDPLRTPESFRAGIDVRTGMWTKKDKEGNLYTPLKNIKTGKIEHKPVSIFLEQPIAFPDQDLNKDVEALQDNIVKMVKGKKINYQIPHMDVLYSPTTNLLPFLESMSGGRGVLASKFQTQALSLTNREQPLVQVQSPLGKSYDYIMGQIINATSPVDGKVVKIDDNYIYIKPDQEKAGEAGQRVSKDIIKINYEKDFPFASKSFLDHTLKVKVGDRVKKEQILTDSNYTKNGTLALGTNLSVGYMPWQSLNSNDAIVVSEAAAKKLTSERMYKISFDLDRTTLLNKEMHKNYFGFNYSTGQYNNLDKNGVIKKGTIIDPLDPVILGLRKSELTSDDVILGSLHKSLVKPYREKIELWNHDFPGKVIDVITTPKAITITVKSKEPSVVGDKLSGRHGNKGVISYIIPDEQMPQDESEKPIDLLFSPLSIVTRTNPSQIIETAVGKVADKIGKPLLVPNFSGRNNVTWARNLLKKYGLKDKETVYDPMSGKKIPGVLVGKQFIHKLFKSTDTNFSARGIDQYDSNLQPTKGGVTGAKAIGRMEANALLAHNARNVLKEVATIKSQKNDAFWRSVSLGLPLEYPTTNFVYDKLLNMLTGAGARVNRKDDEVSLMPLTDKDIMKMSNGEIKNAKIIKAKNLEVEKGGLFDFTTTGGLRGKNWGHINLAEPTVNPLFEEPVKRLLDLTTKQFEDLLTTRGGNHIKGLLKQIDLDKKDKELRRELKEKDIKYSDGIIKQIKYIKALKKENLHPSEAYILSKAPIAPPVIRPVLPSEDGKRLLISDSSHLYKDLILINNRFKEHKANPIVPEEEKKLRPMLYKTFGAVIGTEEPQTIQTKARGVKGFLNYISGVTSPKRGFFQEKLMKRTQDIAGRGTIIPDPTLGVDEIGLPEEMLWEMYGKFLSRSLVQKGYKAIEAQEMIKNKHPFARELLLREIQQRPVFVNRAPTLHRFGFMATYPKPVPGKTIRITPFMERPLNSDNDGDCFSGILVTYDTKARNHFNFIHIKNFPHKKETKRIKGNKEIYAVPLGIKVYGFSEKEQKIKLCNVTEFSVHHNLEMLEVTTHFGKKVEVSRDCSMFGLKPETGKLERFKAEKGIGWGIPCIKQLIAKKENQTTFRKVKKDFSVNLTENLGYFLGAFVGDGWVSLKTERIVGFANTCQPIKDKFIKTARELYPDFTWKEYNSYHEFDGKQCFSQKLHLYSSTLGDIVVTIMDKATTSHVKRLPAFFMTAPKEFLLGLIAGLIDTDGSACLGKAKAKNKPQYSVTYTTVSKELADDIVILFSLFGIRSSISPYTRTRNGKDTEYYAIYISVPDLVPIADQIPCVHPKKKQTLKEISKLVFSDSNGAYVKNKMLPISSKTAQQLIPFVGIQNTTSKSITEREGEKRKENFTLANTLRKAKKVQRITKASFDRILNHIGIEKVKEIGGKEWFDNVTNDTIRWDFIKEVKQLPGKHTAWDLTVPDGNTFMAANGIILYDTVQIHVPVTPEAVEEAKGLTLSNLLFGDKTKNDLMVVPQHDSMLGLVHGSMQDNKNKPIEFKNLAEARQAYNQGKINLGTRVKIKK